MKDLVLFIALLTAFSPRLAFASDTHKAVTDKALLDVVVRTLNSNQRLNLQDIYKGKVILIVNTASKCGYTPQYDALEKLYAKYKNQGLVVLGFPSNDFASQEPGSEKEIQDFCRLTYGVKFPMFAKTRVRKEAADPLYQHLAAAAGEYPEWNFHKYLLDRNGKLAGSYSSATRPDSAKLINKIKSLL